MTTKKIRKPGSGRTPGSFSFVKLTIADLKAKFADDTTPVIVSRKWAEQVGFTVTTAPVHDLMDKIQGLTPQTKVEVTVENLDVPQSQP